MTSTFFPPVTSDQENDPLYVVWAHENIPNSGITKEQLDEAIRSLNEWDTDPYDDFAYAQDQAREFGYVEGASDYE